MAPQEPETLRFASSGCVARLGVVAHMYLCKLLVGGLCRRTHLWLRGVVTVTVHSVAVLSSQSDLRLW